MAYARIEKASAPAPPARFVPGTASAASVRSLARAPREAVADPIASRYPHRLADIPLGAPDRPETGRSGEIVQRRIVDDENKPVAPAVVLAAIERDTPKVQKFVLDMERDQGHEYKLAEAIEFARSFSKPLDDLAAVEEFTAGLRSRTGEWSQQDARGKIAILQATFDAKFTSLGIPPPTIEIMNAEGRGGEFDSRSWSFGMTEAALEKPMADAAATAYHESRHAEQYFLIARYIDQNDLTPPHSDQINADVLAAAENKPLDERQEALAQTFYRSIFGTGSRERNFVLSRLAIYTQADLGRKMKAMQEAETETKLHRWIAEQYRDAKRAEALAAGQKWPDEQQTQNIALLSAAKTAYELARAEANEAYEKFKKAQKEYRELPEEAEALQLGEEVRAALASPHVDPVEEKMPP